MLSISLSLRFSTIAAWDACRPSKLRSSTLLPAALTFWPASATAEVVGSTSIATSVFLCAILSLSASLKKG